MLTSTAVSLCALMLIAALVLPLFGTRVAAVTAAITVLGIIVVCYLVCVTRVTESRAPNAKPIDILSAHDVLSEQAHGDRFLAALLILAAGALLLMLAWLVGR